MSITAANRYDEVDQLLPIISDPIKNRFDGAAHSHLTLITNNEMQSATTANDGDTIETFEFAPPYDESTNFSQLLRQIDNMRWADPIGAANRLLEIDTEYLPFNLYESYSTLAQDLSAQLESSYDFGARTLLWDLSRSVDALGAALTTLFGEAPNAEMAALFGGSSLESMSDDLSNAIRADGDDENGLPKNAGLVTRMATLAYALEEMGRIDALPETPHNPEAVAIDEQRRHFSPPAPSSAPALNLTA